MRGRRGHLPDGCDRTAALIAGVASKTNAAAIQRHFLFALSKIDPARDRGLTHRRVAPVSLSSLGKTMQHRQDKNGSSSTK